MDYGSIPLINLMKTKLNYLSERQAALAQNIANVDTPGYRAMDVVAPDFKAMVKVASGGTAQKMKMSATNPMHLTQGRIASAFKMEKRPHTDELNPIGNNVSIEEEMSKVSQNQGEYQKVLNLYGKTLTLFKTAIGRPGGG